MPNRSQKDNKVSPNQENLWGRVQQALGSYGVPETARLLGLSKPSVYDWKKGKMPGLEMLLKIARDGNVSLHWLITGEGSKTVLPCQEVHSAYGHLQKRERLLIQQLAEEEGRSLEKQMSELIVEALIARGLILDSKKVTTIVMQAIEQTPKSRRHLLLLQLLRELSSKGL